MQEVVPIAMPGTHQKFLAYFKSLNIDRQTNILDVGAGHGAFTKTLHEMGYKVVACDLFPEIFNYKEVDCIKTDITSHFPFPDNSFDMAIAIEVSEHINDHEVFFSELNRIIKPGGALYLSTPNILSLKSRLRFLFQGFYYSFKPLEMNNYDGLQHVASRTLDQYNYIAIKNGFGPAVYDIDRQQSTSIWLMVLLMPWIWLHALLKNVPPIHNNKKLLLGRLLFLCFPNQKGKA
jgi:SAM-dependent methyltransferase